MIREVGCDNLKIFYDSQNYHLEKDIHSRKFSVS